LGEPILEWYHKEPPQGMVKEQKMDKSFSWAFSLNFFHNYNLFFFAHVYLLHALIYGLKFILKQKKNENFKKLYSL